MGRPQAFDSPTAIRRARDVFWSQGFESTSLPDLEAATGLRRSSLYHAFESKRGLFDATVANYLDEVIAPLLAPLQQDQVSSGAVETYLLALRASVGSTSGRSGCLLLRAAASPIGQEADVGAIVAGYRRDLTTALARGVAARHPGIDAGAAAHLASIITALVVTAMTLAPVDREAAVAAIDTARGVNASGVDSA